MRKEHDPLRYRLSEEHPVKRITVNRRKLQYLEGVMSLDRKLVVSGVKKVRSKNTGIELEIGTSERALVTISQILRALN